MIHIRELINKKNICMCFCHVSAKINPRRGITEKKREVPVVVSLTTIPDRINKVYLCVDSLLSQKLKPDYLLLWLADDIAPQSIPYDLKRLCKRGLEIKFCKDIRSYKKIIYSLREYPDSIIVTADDDVVYPATWLSKLYKSYLENTKCVHCYRAHYINYDGNGLKRYSEWDFLSPGIKGPSFRLFPTGNGGVLYPPHSLGLEVFNEKIFLKICPTADDVWLKAMSLLNGVQCVKVSPLFEGFYEIKGTQSVALYHENLTGGRNDQQIQDVFQYYDLFHLLN